MKSLLKTFIVAFALGTLILCGLTTFGNTTTISSTASAVRIPCPQKQPRAVDFTKRDGQAYNLYLGLIASVHATPAGAAGLIGNLFAESQLNPSAVEVKYCNGVGLAQWSFTRKDALLKFAKKRGKSWNNQGVQLQFLIKELKTTEYATLAIMQRATDPGRAAIDIHASFERSADQSSAVLSRRVPPAQYWYAKFTRPVRH